MRINLQAPAACPAAVLDCAGLPLLNQLDGFSVNPRITVCFSADVDTNSIPDGIRFIPYSAAGPVVGINQILYDQPSHCVFAKPDRVLNQQTRYLLTVSNSITAGGAPIAASDEFQACLSQKDTYCRDLSAAAKKSAGKVSGQIVSASLFTTLSATTWLEQARQNAIRIPSVLLPAGLTSTFKLANVKSMTWFPQDNSGSATGQDIPLPALSDVDRIAFGLYLSPNYLQLSGSSFGTILNTPTSKPIAAALPLPVSYHVFLPPVSGNTRIPVVIYGHGLSDNQFGAPTYIASTLAAQGFATLAIEIPGHGFGPASYVKITNSDNSTNTVLTPGRGGQLLQKSFISSDDGCVVSGPLAVRDCARQTAVDLFALVHAIQQTNGLGLNLDPSRIYYIGQSFGGTYGTLLRALEPAVKKAVLNGAGGSSVDVARFAVTGRMIATSYLLGVSPALFNVPPAPAPPYFRNLPFMQPQFNDEYVFRNPGVTVHSTDDGALQIQGAFEVADWLHMPGDPLSYASKLPVGSTLFQFGLGDLEVPNPAESAVVRTANAQPYTWLFHFEVAGTLAPELFGISTPDTGGLPILPHRILSNPTIFADPAETSVALAEQKQAASFFNGAANPDANQFLTAPYTGVPLFENPPATLPDTLGFFQITP